MNKTMNEADTSRLEAERERAVLQHRLSHEREEEEHERERMRERVCSSKGCFCFGLCSAASSV